MIMLWLPWAIFGFGVLCLITALTIDMFNGPIIPDDPDIDRPSYE